MKERKMFGPRLAAWQKTHDALVKAARRLFGKRGAARVTSREIGAAAAISHTVIYHHWGSIEAMFEDVMGNPWPDTDAFARRIKTCRTLDEARIVADAFLLLRLGEERHGPLWGFKNQPSGTVTVDTGVNRHG